MNHTIDGSKYDDVSLAPKSKDNISDHMKEVYKTEDERMINAIKNTLDELSNKEHTFDDIDQLISNIKYRKRQLDKSNDKLKERREHYEHALKAYSQDRKKFIQVYKEFDNEDDYHACYDYDIKEIITNLKDSSVTLLIQEVELEKSIEFNNKAKSNLENAIKELSKVLDSTASTKSE